MAAWTLLPGRALHQRPNPELSHTTHEFCRTAENYGRKQPQVIGIGALTSVASDCGQGPQRARRASVFNDQICRRDVGRRRQGFCAGPSVRTGGGGCASGGLLRPVRTVLWSGLPINATNRSGYVRAQGRARNGHRSLERHARPAYLRLGARSGRLADEHVQGTPRSADPCD